MSDAAVVTGAAGALGRAIARRLAREGLVLLLVDRDEAVAAVAQELAADGTTAAACTADLGAPEPAPPIIAVLDERGWRPRVLVNNAGINRDARAAKMSEDDFAAVIRVDLLGPARLADALRPRIPDGGAVVNIASRAALGNFGQTNYVAAKAGLVGLTRALALRWAPHVRVNALAPGLIRTPMTEGMPEDVLSRLVARVPAQRMGSPEEMADVVAFLASPAASYITGQMVLACGGRSIAA
jgi:3-oxoacyl-[acyl-carrier protein] reductase